MPATKPTNPFYVALLPVGVFFAVTACAYVVMTMRGLDPQQPETTGLIGILARHGTAILTSELALLAVLTVAAIASDDYWTGRFEANEADSKTTEKQ